MRENNMRKTLFRGKQRNGQWIYGSIIVLDEDYVFICPPYKLASSLSIQQLISLNSVMVDPSTVGQYTGLKDKNGERIFEGDIVNLHYFFQNADSGTLGVYEDETTIIAQIVYFEYGIGFISKRENGYVRDYVEMPEEEIECIGNMHDNPELLDEMS